MSLIPALTPSLNATLNAVCGVLLCLAFVFIKTGRWRAHGFTMVLATLVSVVFLTCYLTYHIRHGERSTAATHAPHWLRMTYLAVLLPHLLLAVGMLPMIFVTLLRAYRRQWMAHTRISVPTFWIWLYVSVTGVIVFFMLYHTRLAT
jgi:protein SCO1/2/putative membrane protein